ncbi:zinc finger SWIM domain-containing protein 1-like isoform X1 [Cetorhinus maximus]
MSQAVGFRVGAEFSSYSELHREFRRYQRDCAVQLWTRHSRTIEAQRRRAPKRPMNDALKFAEIDYACIHGGKLFRAKGTGKRTNQRTNKTKCPCVIKVRLSPDGDKFVVKEMIESHNHTVQEAERERFPHQRRFDKAVQSNRADIKENLGGAVEQGIHQEDNPRDKWTTWKMNQTNLEKMVPALASVKDGNVVVVVSKANVLQAIYFQDSSMKQTFEKFPEVLLLDFMHRWEGLWLPTFLLLVIDGNGESDLVCLWFAQNEERETIKQLLRIFKQKNPAAERIQTVMCSGRPYRGEVVSEVLPHSKLVTCLFHTLRTFRADVTTDKLHVTVGQRNLLLEILHNMCYAASAEEYDLLYHQLLDTNTQRAIDYFHKNWHESRSQWVEGFKHESETYLTSTINRVEQLSQKLQALVGKFTDSATFVQDLLKAIDSLRTECDYRAVRMFQKPPLVALEASSTASAYFSLLTGFAFSRVQRELEEAQWVTFLSVEGEQAQPVSRRRAIVTGPSSCQCAFHTSMKLPCRHILAFRQLRGADLFEPALCSLRWTREHYLRNHPVFRTSTEAPAASAPLPPQQPESPREQMTVQQERYRQAFKVAQKLSVLAAECPAEDFDSCLAVMTAVTNIWARGGQVQVTEINVTHTKEERSSASDNMPSDVDSVHQN